MSTYFFSLVAGTNKKFTLIFKSNLEKSTSVKNIFAGIKNDVEKIARQKPT